MRHWRYSQALLLLLVLFLVTACGRGGRAPSAPPTAAVTLDVVWQAAEAALDGNLNASQRQRARDEAMSNLLAYLKQPESLEVARAQWERPAKGGHGPLVRSYAAGAVRVYAMTLPLSGVVPPGERLAVQVTKPALQSFELAMPAGGQLAGARSLEEGGSLQLSLAFVMPRGGMAVAHYQQDARSGEFKLQSGAFRGLPNRFDDYDLVQKDGFLFFATPIEMEPRPRYDEKHPLMLFLDGELGLEWKGGRYVVVDERNYSAFQGFTVALDAKASTKERQEAWEKAVRKLPAYLHEPESWQENLSGKLPPGAKLLTHESGNLSVRVISVPAPTLVSTPSFTVVQYRAGNGLPMAQELTLPGYVQDVRLFHRQGLPGLMVLSDMAAKGSTFQTLSLYAMSGGNDWEPATVDWFGLLPAEDGLQLDHRNSHHLTLQWTKAPGTVSLSAGLEPVVQVCPAPDRCFELTWVGGRLSAAGWVAAKLRAMIDDPGQTASAVSAVKLFLESQGPAGVSAAELARLLGADQGVPVQVFTAGPQSHAVVLPPSGSGASPILIQTPSGTAVHQPGDSRVDRWERIWEVQGEGGRWLVVLGRNAQTDASLRLYKVNGGAWQSVNVVDAPVNVNLGGQVTVRYQPGEKELFIQGHHVLEVIPSPDGQSISICEQFRLCTVYQFTGSHWVFK